MNQLHLFEDPEAPAIKNFTIYRSSAGSGKTFTLVKEYLKIVLRNPQDYKHILAITFTNKATEEMKERILQQLTEMAAGRNTPMRQVIAEEVEHYEQKLNITDRSQKALTNILHDYSRFSVSTIDHFFSQLVRSLARELKLSLNYEIDVDDDTAMVEALQLLYESITKDHELRNWIKDFAFSRIEDDKGWQLDYSLIEFGKELFKEKFHQGFSKLNQQEVNISSLRALEEDLQKIQRAYGGRLKTYARSALKIISEHGLETSDFKRRDKGAANTFNKILKNDFVLNPTFQKTARGEDDWYTVSSPKREEIKQVVSAGLGKIATDIYQHYLDHYQEYITAKQLQNHIYSYGLLDAISEQLKVYRQSNNLMLLSHNSFLLREIISDREAPFLFEKLGSYYKHVLMDEFQDTSTYQWENIKPLISNALDQRNHVLLVGDVKQSIYRWRGGDLNLLLQKAVQDLAIYQDQLQEKTLQVNRRSARQVVDFNNQFFNYALQLLLPTKGLPENPAMLSEVYGEVEQQSKADSIGGVSIQFFERDNKQWRQQALDSITEIIQVHVEGKGKFSDFLVLCDRNQEVADVSHHLSHLGIPVDSDQALKLSGYWAVRMLISGMYLLIDNNDQLAKAELAFLYHKGQNNQLDFDKLFAESRTSGKDFLVKYLPAKLAEHWETLSHRNIYEWVSQVIPLLISSQQADPFIMRFLEVCREQNARGHNTAADFIGWWEEHEGDQMVVFPSHQEAVRVMTIHKAKGLESPIVLIPWADYELKPRSDSLFWTDQLPSQYEKYKLLPLSFSKELLESQFAEAYQREFLEGLTEGLNTVYVAFTRARQQLHVCSVVPYKKRVELDDLGSLYKLLWAVCNQGDWEHCWNPDQMRLTLGDLDENVLPYKKEAVPSQPIEELRVRSYEAKVSIRSGQDRMFTLLDNYHAHNIRQGIQTHSLLERLHREEDLPVVLDQMQAEGIIAEIDRPTLVKQVESLFNDALFSSFFDPAWEIFAEREIAGHGKVYKPDRVITKGRQTRVIDYKREKESQKHHRQLEQYAQLLGDMGHEQVDKYLVYVSEIRVVQI